MHPNANKVSARLLEENKTTTAENAKAIITAVKNRKISENLD